MIGRGVMKNKVLLIRPPTVMKGTSFIATQFPMNLAGMAAVLLVKGYDVSIWDFDVEHFSEEDFKTRIQQLSPFIVGISCYTPTVINSHKIATRIKKYLPKAVIVAGGPHISALPEESMREFHDFDIGVIGEGEETLKELADRFFAGRRFEDVAGIVYRRDTGYHITPKRQPIKELDDLPVPARQLLKMDLYKGQSHRGFSRSFLKITEIMTSRGCPNRCLFCASDVVMDKGVRFRSALSVKREIDECVRRYNFNHFTISDDTFTLKEDRLYDICDEFAKHKVTWNCNARVWPLSREMLSIMARSGCVGITFGVESGSPRILELIKKNITLEQVENAFRWSKEAGIKLVEADVIIGSHPSETKEDIQMTKKLLARISPDIVMASVIVPYPGTGIYDIMKEKDLLRKDSDWDSFILFGKEPSWRTDNFGPKELVALQRKMMLGFYMRPFYIMKTLGKMKSMNEAAYWLRGGRDFLMDCFKSYFKRNVDKSRKTS